ncbi:T9SS type B sorting domain-containing protein [Flavobacteriaceae bacterium]|nr:T9SS type B sorting domain-containing protein [Flavobacteriaceae bacterium]
MKLTPFKLIIIVISIFFVENSYSQGGTCDAIDPFCAGDQALIFPNCNNTEPTCNATAEPGPDYGCLFTQPYPAWFYLQIDQTGTLEFDIIQNTAFDVDGNPTGTGLDVDFIAWGPFAEGDNLCDFTELQAFNEIDCSYSIDNIENFTIPNGQPGEVYVLLITNYSDDPGFIQLVQTNTGDTGAGDTDCSIISSTEGCEGDTITLDGTTAGATNYIWEYDDGLGGGFIEIFNGIGFPTIDVTNSGIYQVTVAPTNITIPFDIIFHPNPIVDTPPGNLFQCDDGTNTGVFDLTINTTVVLGPQNPADFEVKYYETFAGSDTDMGEIINPTAFLIGMPPQQTIFLRIQDIASGTCYSLDNFIIDFSPVTTGTMTEDRICDADGDGVVEIDLSFRKDAEALGTQNPLDYTVTYHSSQIDADAGTPFLPNPYPANDGDQIFVRVQNNAFSTCFDTTESFFINLAAPEIDSPAIDISQCNNEIFDLTINTPIVLGTPPPPDQLVTYHNNPIDADTGENPIPTPDNYTITGNSEEIFVRIEESIEDITFQEDFGTGLGRVAHPFTIYNFNPATTLNAGEYVVTNISTGLNGGWHQAMEDFTPGDIDGRMIVFDATDGLDELYRREITVAPNTEFRFEFAMTTMYDVDTGICPGTGIDSRIVFEVEDATGVILATNTTGNVVNESNPNWIIYSLNFNSGTNTTVEIVMNNDITGACGNDLAIDDIKIISQEHCFVTDSFDIKYAPVSIELLTDEEFCDDDTDGILEVNLPDLKDLEALGLLDPLLYTVTYHNSQVDADAGTPILANPYPVTGPSEEIFVRIENNALITENPTDCFVTDSFELFVYPLVEAIEPLPFILCDDFPNDGFAEFDLLIDNDGDGFPDLWNEITGGNPNLIVTYHELVADAETGANPIDTATPFINTIPSYQIIYPRVESITNDICFDVTELVLQVDQAPALTDPISDYFICDDVTGDGVEVFDLLSKDTEILNTQLGVTLGYYETQVDADAATNIILTPNTYLNTSNPQTVWVRADNSAGCVTVLSFELLVLSAPVYTAVPTFELCDDIPVNGFTEFDLSSQNTLITGGDPFLNVSYHFNQIDADNNIILPEPYLNTIPDIQPIIVRVEDITTGCFETFTMELIVVPPPSITTPDDLEYCDPDSDGFGVFTLTDADSQVTGGIPTGNLQVTYHYLIEDAQNGINALTSPYANDVPFLQTVHVRLYDQTTQCYSITTLDLVVLDSPLIEQPDDLEVCDDDTDGVAIFDLTDGGNTQALLLNLIDPADWPNYTITYYEDAGLTVPIGNPEVYFNIPPSPQTIYIVVEDLINGCLSQTTTLQLWVYPPPELIAPLPYALCDVTEITGPGDELEPFDLESKTDELTGGNPNISITYYETQAQADTGDPLDALTSPYTNISNPQTIFVRAEESNNLCTFSTGTTLDLVVNPLPSPETPIPLEVCDDNNDGLTEFILTDKDDEIIAGEPGVAITYHELVTDAETGANPLTSPYTNTTTYSQIVYARVEFPIALGGTGCFTIVELELVAIPTPVIPVAIPDLVACDDDGDGLTEFDLTLQQDIIFGDQDPIDYTLTYHTTEPDAQDGTNPIATPEAFLNTTNPQTIWVRLQDNANTCIKIGSFELVVELAPVFTLVPVVELCDDLVQDGFTEFDLNLQNNIITGGDPTLSVIYYPTELDAEDATNPLSLPHTNVVNPETIFVRVQSGVTGCYATFPMELIVVEAPTIVTPNPLEVCDPDNDGFSEFILTDADLEVTGGIPTGNLVVTYHYLLEDAINDVLPLASPYENEVPFLQTVFVRLVDQTTGCFNTTTLDLIVKDSPQIVAPDPIVACDDDSDGIEVFDLTQSEPQILENAGTGAYTVNYYEDAALTLEIVNPTAYSNISNPQTIFIVVEDQDPNNICTSETTLLLEVVDAPTLVPPTELEVCDAITLLDGFELFDLESKTDEITGGNPIIEVTYYETQADADAGTNALVSPYTNIENPQTIFIRAEDLNTGCVVSQGITLSLVVNPLPSPEESPEPLESCDDNNDGLTEFILTDKDDEIIDGEPGVAITYHELVTDAETGANPLTSPYTNTTTYSQIVYARVEFPIALGGTGCFTIVELELVAIPTPVIPVAIPDLVACDDDGDGLTEFDLTLQQDIIFGDQDPIDYTLTYHTTEPDAQDGTNPIATPEAFLNTTNPQTIWVRLQDNANTCIKIGSFELVVELAPVFTLVPVVELCDDLVQDGFTEFDLNLQNNIITGGDPTLSVIYYPTELDAEDATNPLSLPHTNVVNPETIFVRVQSGVTGCYATFPMELIVVEAPTIVTPNPLEVCDPDNDGFSEFILTDADLEVTGGIPTGNLVVTYHYLLEDAINDVLPLASPYENEVPFLQTVFVRLVDQTTGCFNTTTLDLIVKDSPQIVAPDPIVACDDDSDGIEVFDLTQSEPQILENAGTGAYTVNYYEDAALTLEIVNPTAYSNISNPQTIFIVVEDQDPTNLCTSETTLLLEVVDAPILVPPTELEVCDAITLLDGFELFDLESKTDEITGGDLTIEVTYYETQADADAGTNALVSPYTNIENPQTIFIRADDLNTGCVVSQGITLSLVVNPLPSPITPTPLESCDVSNDGFTFFTLTDKDDEIIGGEPGVTVSYYETLFDAEQAVDPLVSPYTNIVTPSQIVYARAEFPIALGGTGCFKIVEMELVVIPTPVIPIEMEDLVICDDDGDGFAEFDLTLQETIVFGDDQDPDDYTLTYYLLETDAQDNVNPIANPEAFLNTTNPQTIWVRLQDNVTECPKIGSFDIRVEIGPEIFEPTPLTQCDDLGEPNDEVTLFDLTAKNEEITGGALGLTVQYYETQADAEADVNEIDPDTAYQNTSNPQIVWVRVTDVNTLCVDTTVSLTIRVAANPEPEQPDPIVLCDVTNPGDQQEVFDLTIRQAQILDGETWTLSYHNSFEDAVDNNAPIATPTAYTNISTPEIVYVRVSIDPTDPQACFEIVELELIVNPIPDGSAVVTPYIICEIPSDDEAIFDLTTKNGEILNGQDPVLFEVLFYESQADADAMLNPIQEPEIYTNQTNPQTIFVVILNTDTDCFVATQSFDIEEREGAVANTPLEPYAICDYYNANDGIAEFDLLNQELLDEILGGQDPLGYQLDFYGTLENAELEIAPLPIIYENVINPQIIYARVTNITSDCYDITEVILKVELIPEVVLEPSYRLCVDAAGVPIQEEEGSASPPVIDTQLDPSIYMFEWQLNGDVLLGEIGASITALQEGNYSVTVTEILTGCMAATDTQVVISSPPLNYDVQVTEAFASQHNITATAEGIGEYIFQLDDNPFQDSGYFINVVPGTHTITIKDIYGCGSVTTEVAVIDFPRFITPNQDGYHDTWNILGISIGDPTAKIYIFDRFGKLLKQISPMSPGWDGTYNGNPLPSNDYWFRVEYTENNIKKEFSGHFTLKR